MEPKTSPCNPDGSKTPFYCWLVIFIVMGLAVGVAVVAVLRPSPPLLAGSVLLFTWAALGIKIAAQWQKAVVLHLGRFSRVMGPGPFVIFPFIETVTAWIDQRIATTSFTAEQTLTRDTVPVDVDAVMFWVIWDPGRAALEVADYQSAVSWAAQTALREVIGRTMLSDILASRDEIDEELRRIIDARTEPWGIAVQNVEIRDVIIPASLQEAMSREAQAERERRARLILGTAEVEVAGKFAEASGFYQGNQVALQLRAMNILYEALKERGSLVVVPSSVPQAVDIGLLAGLTAAVGDAAAAAGQSGPDNSAGSGRVGGAVPGPGLTKDPEKS